MVDFNKVERVTNVVLRPTPLLTIKHVVELISIPKATFGSPKVYNYEWDYEVKHPSMPKAPQNNIGIIFTPGNSYIEFEFKRPNNSMNDNKRNVIKHTLIFRDIPMLLNVLDNAKKWLTSNNQDTFIRDIDGKPMKIVDPLLNIGCPTFTGNLSFKPCIIRDASDVRYEGVAMLSIKDGELCNFTAPEFLMFKMCIEGLANNYYMANLALANQALSYCMYNNLMEVLNKNGKSSKS